MIYISYQFLHIYNSYVKIHAIYGDCQINTHFPMNFSHQMFLRWSHTIRRTTAIS